MDFEFHLMRESLEHFAHDCRLLLQQALAEVGVGIEGSCFYASELLHAALQNFWVPGEVGRFSVIEGGDGETDGGIIDANGDLCGHYWIRAGDTQQNFVVDITADQFGLPAILVLPYSVAAEWYRPGSQTTISDHIKEFGLTAKL